MIMSAINFDKWQIEARERYIEQAILGGIPQDIAEEYAIKYYPTIGLKYGYVKVHRHGYVWKKRKKDLAYY